MDRKFFRQKPLKRENFMTEIFLVDDSPLMRQTMKQLIELEPNFKVCGEAGTAEETMASLKEIKPDVVLMDISLGGDERGIELIKALRLERHKFPILTVSLHEEALYAGRVMKAGGQGYLMKQDAPEHIIHAIQKVVTGGRKHFFTMGLTLQQ